MAARYATQLLTIIFGLLAIASAFSQTADDPWRLDAEAPMIRSLVETSDDLQAILDGPEQIIDCKGKIFKVSKAIICSVKHHGKHLLNCDIYFDGDAGNSVAWWLFIQNRTVGGIYYYPGRIDFTWENVRLFGNFVPPTINQEINEMLADREGKGINIISNWTYGAGFLKFKNVEIHNSGNSAVAISAMGLEFEDFIAIDIAKHGIGARSTGGTVFKGDRILLDNCGGALDFHGDDFVLPKPDIATVNELTIRNARGRNKISGLNWEVTGTKWLIEKDTAIDTNYWSAFDCARRPRKLDITGLTVKNYPTQGFRFGPDTIGNNSPLSIKNAKIDGSMYGMQLQQPGLALTNIVFDNYRNLFVSGMPASANAVIGQNKRSDLYWATVFDGCETRMDNLNAEYGTTFRLYYSVPASVRALMEHK